MTREVKDEAIARFDEQDKNLVDQRIAQFDTRAQYVMYEKGEKAECAV